MSKSNKRGGRRGHGTTRVRGTTDRSTTTDVVTQLEVAIRNPHAALIGALIGGLVPWFGRTLAHGEIQETWASNRALAIAMCVVVVGCGVFSGLSVYKFGRAAFGDARKALGFVLALEGVMLVAHGVTSAVALTVLILINAASNGAVIALARDATQKKREADARGAATRAAKRVGGPDRTVRVPPSTPAPDAYPASAHPGATRGAPRGVRGQGANPVVHPWQYPPFHNVIDAEIISETKFLA